MRTVVVEIDSQNGFHLLEELEKLNVLRIVSENGRDYNAKLSEKYKGVFSNEDSESFNQHTQKMRQEW